MPLPAGARLGPYELVAPLGAGGMGEVYRARDPRLGREVAVKVLPASFAQDPDRLRRFEQEARATSGLNHPNILAIFDLGTHDGMPYVVSELLEGETLRQKMGGSPLPVRKAVDIAVQMARGLAAAHEKGVVHRDLKPDNVMVTREGRAKILDFGLAKLLGGDLLTEGETATAGGAHGTDAGKVLGTVGYMSPEQVRAQPVDHRSDVFSFGAVLYEMLSGRRAFAGQSAVETMNAILKEDPPDLSDTSRHLPPALERIVSHCLEKNREERFQSARDLAFDLEQVANQSAPPVALARAFPRGRWTRSLALGLAALALTTAAFVAGRQTAPRRFPSFQALTFRRGTVSSARFAPGGRTVVYSAEWEGRARELFSAEAGSPEWRTLDLKGAMRVAGISSAGEMAVLLQKPGAGAAFTLARRPIAGGAPREVLDRVFWADWSPDGTSFAVVRPESARLRLEYPVGKVLYEAGASIQFPRVSPTGDRVAFTYHPLFGDTRGDVAVVDLAGRKTTLAGDFEDVGGVAWSPDGREVWFTGSRRGTERHLMAVDLKGRQRDVERVPGHLILQDIARDGRVLLTLGSRRPVIMALPPGETAEQELSWLDYSALSDLSPDGRTLLFSEQGATEGPGYAVYVRGTDGSPAVRLGKGEALGLSPDGRLAVTLDVASTQLVLLPTGIGEPRTLPRGPLAAIHWAGFFPDGKRLLIAGGEEGRGLRLYMQDLAGGPPRAIAPEGVFVLANAISPDGEWVAAGQSGQVQLYPVAGGEPKPVPGAQPRDEPLRFSPDGRILFVRAAGTGAARIARIDIRSGRREAWKELGPADFAGVGNVQTVRLTPDGRAHAYGYQRSLSTLYVVEGLR